MNIVTLISKDSVETIELMSKADAAAFIVDRIVGRIKDKI